MSKVDQDTMRIIIGCLLANRNGNHMVQYGMIKASFERYLKLPEGQWEQIMKDQGWN
jgi:hypothetical protein